MAITLVPGGTPPFPSFAYNLTSPAQIVLSQAAFNALGTGWSFTPFAPPGQPFGPFDPGLTDTDIRLQQLVIEARMQNMMMAQAFGITDDPQAVLRPDILANDSSVTS